MKVSSTAEMRKMDSRAIKEYGIADLLLMENAGIAAFYVLMNEVGIRGKKFGVFCGGGNNGGDGFVVAREIHSNGGAVKIFLLGDESKYTGSAKKNFEIVSRLPLQIRKLDDVGSARMTVFHSDAVVDALFGTGLDREVGGKYHEAIELINESEKTVMSLDIPSGVNGDTGEVMGTAVKADFTVTFGLPKVGNMLYPGFELCGRLYVTHISFPPAMTGDDALKVEINNPPALPPRPRDGHKKDFGEVLFVAGASSYFGAPFFAALSFMKAGGGYARLAAPRSMAPFIANKGSEIVFAPQEETLAGSIALENKIGLLELAEQMDWVVLGPGISLEEETQQLARELAAETARPLLLDGDGITAVCRDVSILKKRKAPTVLTPHLGEMSRLTRLGIPEIKAKRIEVLQRTAKELKAVIVLKGGHSLVGYPDGRVFINMSGNPGMASAGSGDVLAGTIAAMGGLGLAIPDAVRKGVFIHGFAGDLAAEDLGEDGITAQDVLDYLPVAMRMDREGLDQVHRERYSGVRLV